MFKTPKTHLPLGNRNKRSDKGKKPSRRYEEKKNSPNPHQKLKTGQTKKNQSGWAFSEGSERLEDYCGKKTARGTGSLPL